MEQLDSNFLNGYLPYLLRRADQTLSAPFYAVLTEHGVARSEWRVLAVLHDHGELCIADLVTEALSPQPTVTHAVRRLEQRRLIRRTLGTQDRRQRFVSMTPSGSRLTKMLIKEAKQLQADALADAGDLSDLVQKLRDVTRSVEARGLQEEAARAG